MSRDRRRDRRDPRVHRGPRAGREGLRHPLYRYLAVDGRAGRAVGKAHPTAAPVPDQRRADGKGQAHGHLHALPARLPRPGDDHRRGDLPEVRPERHGGHRRGLPRQPRAAVPRSPTRSSSAATRGSSARPRTACTRSRPSSTRRSSEAKDNNTGDRRSPVFFGA